jgi:hypothetical protein
VLHKHRDNCNSLFVYFLHSIEIVLLYVALHRSCIDFTKFPRSRLGVKYVDHDRRPDGIINGLSRRGRIVGIRAAVGFEMENCRLKDEDAALENGVSEEGDEKE